MDINYELYKVFYYVATSLSFSEASKKLYISQSAVSQLFGVKIHCCFRGLLVFKKAVCIHITALYFSKSALLGGSFYCYAFFIVGFD